MQLHFTSGYHSKGDATKECSGQFCLLGQSQNLMWLLLSFKKNSLSLWEIMAEWIWYKCNEESKILLVVWRESIMMMMWLILEIPTTWLIPHCIANNLALVVVILTAQWIVLITDLSCEWIYNIEVATWFLMLVSEMIIGEEGLDNTLKVMLLRFLMWFLMFEEHGWNENQSGKESISWFPGSNSLSKNKKKGRSSLWLLSMLIRGEFKRNLCFGVRLSRDKLCKVCPVDPSELRIDLIMWLEGSNEPLKRNLLYSFLRWRWIGMRPEIASISAVGDIQNTLDIQRAALHCIFLSMLRG